MVYGLVLAVGFLALAGKAPAEQDDQIIASYKQALEVNAQDTDIRYKLATAYYERNMFAEAINQYQEILSYNPQDAAAYYNIGLIHYQQQDVTKALDYFVKAQQYSTRDDNLYYVMGMCYLTLQDYPHAIDMMNLAVKINPDNLDAKINLANAYANHSQFKPAVEIYKKVLKDIGDDQFVKRNLGSALYNLGLEHFLKDEFQTSLDYLQESFAFVEDRKKAYLLAANCEFNLEHFPPAVRLYQQVIRLEPGNIDGHYYLAYSYRRLDSLDRALNEFEEVLVLDPAHKKAIKYKAEVLDELFTWYLERVILAYKDKDYVASHRYLKNAQELAPDNESVRKYRKMVDQKIRELVTVLVREGQQHYQQGEYAQSYRKFSTVLELDPDRTEVKVQLDSATVKLDQTLAPWYQEAVELLTGTRFYQAIRKLRTILSKKPDYRDALTLLNRCQEQLNGQVDSLYGQALTAFNLDQFQQAVDIFDKVLEVNPEFVDDTGRMQKARARLKSLMEERREKITTLTTTGIALFKQGNFGEALEKFQDVLKLDSDNSQAQVYIEKCKTGVGQQVAKNLTTAAELMKAKNYTAALEAFERVLKLEPAHPQAGTAAQHCRSVLLLAEGQRLAGDKEYNKAVKKLQRSVELDRSHTQAVKALQQTLAARDQEIAASLKIGRQYLKADNLRSAEKVFNLILEKYQDNHPEAKQNLEKIQTLRTSQANQAKIDEYYSLGVDYYTKGEYQKAVAEWNKVLDLQPDHEKAKRNIENAKKKLEFYQNQTNE